MEWVLHAFSNLILFTFGLAVLIFWIVIILVVIDEILDLLFNRNKEDQS